ncbi:MAG: DNA translocase FtsK 4TM domain-containing protein, partial [Opitutaceae bacterium]
MLCFVAAAFLAVGLIDYHPEQVGLPFRSTTVIGRNLMGWIGADAIWVLLFAIGVSAWLLPVFLAWMLFVSVRNSKHLSSSRTIGMVIACVSFAGVAAMFDEMNWGADPSKWGSDYFPRGFGGLLGASMYHRVLADALGPFGSGLILGTVYCGALLFVFLRDTGAELEKIISHFTLWRANRRQMNAEIAEQRRREKEAMAKQKAAATALAASPNSGNTASGFTIGPSGRKTFVPKTADEPLAKSPVTRPPHDMAESAKLARVEATSTGTLAPIPRNDTRSPLSLRSPNNTKAGATAETATDTTSLAVAATGRVELNIVKPEEPKRALKITLPRSEDASYQFPPLSLLKDQVKPASSNSIEEHQQNAENLLRILSEFGVEVTLGEIHVGPVITRYEVVPAAGVRVEKIASLDKNIALGMRAQSVRILAPIPGKAAVGVEVPNQHPTPVGMRELLESEDWAAVKSEIPIALGKDVSGKPLVSDLSKMPHLLIAGATGSGKSVCINAIVASILYSKSPKDLRLIMVDPKVVELKIFNSLPHMLIPV